jgi:hypothetical protein
VDAYGLIKLAHVVVWGYWVGSDLVVNQLTHYLTHAERMDGRERNRLWGFLLDVDQHPRNALILSVPLGLTLAAMLHLMPIGRVALAGVWVLSAAWFAFMWMVHLRGNTPIGATLRTWDVRIRYGVIAIALMVGVGSLLFGKPVAAGWLAAKLVLFALVAWAGIGIRYYIQQFMRTWPAIVEDGSTPDREAAIRQAMRRGTWVLAMLHVLLGAIAYLGYAKPF